jgi:imidazolonepropionase-like amidohydrolase
MLIAGTLIVLVGCTPAVGFEITADPSELIIITNGTIIAADGSEPIANGTVVIEGDWILYAGEDSGVSIPDGARVFDAQGGTILPGFFDAHTHGTADPAVRRAFLLGGVTSICDLGATLDEMDQFDLDQFAGGPVARAFFAGPIITAPGGLPDAVLGTELNYEVANPEEGRAAVQYLDEQGVDQIKVYLQNESNGVAFPMIDETTLAAIVAEAHARDLPVRAHVTYATLLGMAVNAGVDTVEHVPVNMPRDQQDPIDEDLMQRMMESDDPIELLLSERSPEFAAVLREMAETGIIMVPTLDRPYGVAFRSSSLTQEERFGLDVILGIVGKFSAMGGEVALGTDFNVGTSVLAGMPIHEMEMLLAAGLTRMEIIEAGTRIAAEACGQGDALGTLEPGMLADVIVVAGDPLEDLSAMEDVVLIILGGEVVVSYEASTTIDD